MSSKEQLEQLIAQREKHVTRIFWTSIEIAVIFLIPLVAAVLLIKFVTSGAMSWVVIIAAFVSSWALVIFKYQKLSKKMTALDAEIRALRKELDIPARPEHRYPDEIED